MNFFGYSFVLSFDQKESRSLCEIVGWDGMIGSSVMLVHENTSWIRLIDPLCAIRDRKKNRIYTMGQVI
jgi:hypothetical protein